MNASWLIQRAKENWLKQGEEDLKFLFSKVKRRQGSNKMAVNLFAAFPGSNNREVINCIVQHFQGLYNPSPPSLLDVSLFPIGNSLRNLYWEFLSCMVTDREIKKSVFSGSSTSTPGPDGFNYHFYKTSWLISGPLVCKAVRSFFEKGYIPRGVKATILALIPKTRNVQSISDFRPIALCNTIYKIIAKTLSNRLKPIMPHLVKHNQSGFVKSRISTNNIILAKEILYMARKNSIYKVFCAKLDIRKAFDTVSREFLLNRMLQKGFPNSFVNLIKACTSDVNYSVLVNGAIEGFFSSTSGLRQGCPLSPYLFCLVMDAFSALLDNGEFKGINVDDFSLSHLLYADDVLVFGEATVENCLCLKKIISTFSNATGLHVNLSKSSIMFPKFVKNHAELCNILSIHNISEVITYLGIPLSFNRLKVADFLPLTDSISVKLSGWKASLLSFAGRLQFLKYTILNSIAYWILGAIIPKTVSKFFKKVCSKFLFFGDCNAGKKLHLVSWDNVTRPKEFGGLGLPSLASLQFAFNCSIITRMYNLQSPLSQWLTSRYISPWSPIHSFATKFWRDVCLTAGMVKYKFSFKITRNAPISFRWDHWLCNSRVEEFLATQDLNYQFPTFYSNSLVRDFILGDNLALLSCFSPLMKSNILNVGIEEGYICLWWDNNKDCKHYNFVLEFYKSHPTVSWHKFIWGPKFGLRYSCFSWLALVGGIKTAEVLNKRNILVPLSCSLYFSQLESVAHLFFECPYSFNIIRTLIRGSNCFLMEPSLLQLLEWIDGNGLVSVEEKNFFSLIVCCCVYFIWKERNQRRFNNAFNSSKSTVFCIRKVVQAKISNWKNSSHMLGKLYS
ncbi:Putative ribonuclease H protein [Dendrobium catenatum]|uniref:Ribonuclease H protein n=1 Tax=Dendrobium catenatum TaxID=906689 RepID=A0A2I0VIK3_9ASPA|nr:Putative ribonuclease H protein [Dendrobium catenatum]